MGQTRAANRTTSSANRTTSSSSRSVWMMTKKKARNILSMIRLSFSHMAVRVINVHFIQRLADGLGDDPYGVYRLFGFLIERTGLVVFVFFGFHRWRALVL